MAADLGLNRIQVRDVYNDGGHWVAVLIGGIFAMLACVLSAIQIRSHWKHWTHPSSQKHVVRILYMVPIYALSAWGSLTFLNLSSYIDFVRGVYEAFVIYTFMILLTKYLGGHNGVVEWMKYKGRQPWPSPMCCLKPVVPDSRYLYYLKYGALQYTISMPLCSLAAVVLTSFGAYEDGVIAYNNGYPYIAFIMNCSQLVSLYCLVWLYVCLKNELAPFGPLAKFMVVKAVVFATFWQGVGLAIAASQGWLKATDNFSVGEVQVGLQDFLVVRPNCTLRNTQRRRILMRSSRRTWYSLSCVLFSAVVVIRAQCIEMFIAACTHKYTFGSETYADGTLRLIMEQRALYLAEQSYKRGVDAQKAALAAHEVSQGLEPTESVEETAEEKEKRQAAMADLIRKNMDDDTEGDVLFNEELVDWDSGALPSATATTAGDTVLTTDSDGHLKTTRKPMRASAYDYVYAYELEHQKAEGVDEDAPGASPLHRVVSLRSPLTSPLRPPTTGGRRAKKEEERIAITDDFGTEEYGTDGGVFAYTPSVAEHGAASAASPSVEPEYAADAAAPADVSLDLSMSSDPYPAEMAAEANSYHQGTNGYGAPPQQHHVDLDQVSAAGRVVHAGAAQRRLRGSTVAVSTPECERVVVAVLLGVTDVSVRCAACLLCPGDHLRCASACGPDAQEEAAGGSTEAGADGNTAGSRSRRAASAGGGQKGSAVAAGASASAATTSKEGARRTRKIDSNTSWIRV